MYVPVLVGQAGPLALALEELQPDFDGPPMNIIVNYVIDRSSRLLATSESAIVVPQFNDLVWLEVDALTTSSDPTRPSGLYARFVVRSSR